jgi:cytochrome P450 / NADPH-cytochrome P450 reductase
MKIRDMFDDMHDIASQLVLKWARHGPQHRILLTDDFTRLALDTISLCSMGYRFNSYYSEAMHPFVGAMSEFLVECGVRANRPPLPGFLTRSADRKFQQNIELMRVIARGVLEERAADPTNPRKDLLTAMLYSEDTKTGQKMTNDSIIDNLITFLIAGHETTSGLLSYAVVGLTTLSARED